MTDPLNVTLMVNSTLQTTSNMVCGCLESSAAGYWGDLFSQFVNQSIPQIASLLIIVGMLAGFIIAMTRIGHIPRNKKYNRPKEQRQISDEHGSETPAANPQDKNITDESNHP